MSQITYRRRVGTTETLAYTYDNAGNITTIQENGVLKAAYTYDQFGQLVREDNAWADRTYLYHYDNGGNLAMVQECYYRTGTMHQTDLIQNISYTYGDATTDGTPAWKDLLTSYNGTAITYDAIGNPLNWGTSITNMTWNNGRRLTSLKNGASVIQYGYDESGLRTRKYTGTYTVYDRDASGNLVHETRNNGTNHLYYYYDANGSIGSISYNGTRYAFRKNLQGDVIAILDTNSNVVARYTYDAWGKILSITDGNGNINTASTFIGNINPIRYRGYYYDTETGWYYLNSRYYDPQVRRMLNCDYILNIHQGLNGANAFVYCGNDPINRCDPNGAAWIYNGVEYKYDGSIADFHRAENGLSPLAYQLAIDSDIYDDTYDDLYDQNYDDRLRSSDAKKRERRQIDDAFGKDRAKEKGNQKIYMMKKGRKEEGMIEIEIGIH